MSEWWDDAPPPHLSRPKRNRSYTNEAERRLAACDRERERLKALAKQLAARVAMLSDHRLAGLEQAKALMNQTKRRLGQLNRLRDTLESAVLRGQHRQRRQEGKTT